MNNTSSWQLLGIATFLALVLVQRLIIRWRRRRHGNSADKDGLQ